MNFIQNEILKNPILRNVQEKFENQTVKGLAKYGETVNPASYDVVGWINHRQQEAIDAVVYDEVLIKVISKIVDENKQLREALKFYADTKVYFPQNGDVCSQITLDYGSKARLALEDIKQ